LFVTGRDTREIRHSLETQVGAERWTRLDRALVRDAAAHGGAVDLRLKPGQQQESFHGIKIGRMRKLEALGLARPLGPALWSISENAEEVLRELGERNDIIKRIHRGLTEKGWERGISDFVLHGEAEPMPVIGDRPPSREWAG
jgi:type IV secretory pathway VirD2 relaxase